MRLLWTFLLPLILFGALGTAYAGVYKWVAPDGTVHFSDQPRQGAEEVKVKPLPTIEIISPKSLGAKDDSKQRAKPGYKQFSIVEPQADEAIRANNGSIGMRMDLAPSLRDGHEIAVTLDGQPLTRANTLAFQLNNLPRGEHVLQAAVVDGKGKSLITSTPVRFYILRVAGG